MYRCIRRWANTEKSSAGMLYAQEEALSPRGRAMKGTLYKQTVWKSQKGKVSERWGEWWCRASNHRSHVSWDIMGVCVCVLECFLLLLAEKVSEITSRKAVWWLWELKRTDKRHLFFKANKKSEFNSYATGRWNRWILLVNFLITGHRFWIVICSCTFKYQVNALS